MLWLGIGCQRHTSASLINESIRQLLDQYCLQIDDLTGVATLDTKFNEPGIITVCRMHNLQLKLFSRQILAQVRVPNPSIQVSQKVQTTSVAEAAAMMAILEQLNCDRNGSLTAILVAPKTIFRQTNLDATSSVTLAIASSSDLCSSIDDSDNKINQTRHNRENN